MSETKALRSSRFLSCKLCAWEKTRKTSRAIKIYNDRLQAIIRLGGIEEGKQVRRVKEIRGASERRRRIWTVSWRSAAKEERKRLRWQQILSHFYSSKPSEYHRNASRGQRIQFLTTRSSDSESDLGTLCGLSSTDPFLRTPHYRFLAGKPVPEQEHWRGRKSGCRAACYWSCVGCGG